MSGRNISRATMKALTTVTLLFAALVPIALLATGALPYKVYVVHTGSMSPTIPSTSAVIVRKGVYDIGSVTTFTHHSETITHRLVARNTDGTYVTKGDGNDTVDPWTVAPANLIGDVVAAPRMLGYWLVYLKNPAGAGSVLLAALCLGLITSITKDLSISAAAHAQPM